MPVAINNSLQHLAITQHKCRPDQTPYGLRPAKPNRITLLQQPGKPRLLALGKKPVIALIFSAKFIGITAFDVYHYAFFQRLFTKCMDRCLTNHCFKLSGIDRLACFTFQTGKARRHILQYLVFHLFRGHRHDFASELGINRLHIDDDPERHDVIFNFERGRHQFTTFDLNIIQGPVFRWKAIALRQRLGESGQHLGKGFRCCFRNFRVAGRQKKHQKRRARPGINWATTIWAATERNAVLVTKFEIQRLLRIFIHTDGNGINIEDIEIDGWRRFALNNSLLYGR